MTEEKEERGAALEALVKRLAKATGLSDDLAQAVVETAVDTIKSQRPDKAEQVDKVLTDEKTARRVGNMVEKLAKKTPKPEE